MIFIRNTLINDKLFIVLAKRTLERDELIRIVINRIKIE